MKILKVGDKSQAICKSCKAVVSTTYLLRTVPFDDGDGEVKDVLVSVCNTCDTICSLPRQSTPAVKKALTTKRKPIECKVPAHMIAILDLACNEIGCETDFKNQMFKYYINKIAHDESALSELHKNSENELIEGKPDKRISIKGRRVKDDLNLIIEKTKITKITDIIKLITIQIGTEILDMKKPGPIKDLKTIAIASV